MDMVKIEVGNGWVYVKLGRRDWFWQWGQAAG